VAAEPDTHSNRQGFLQSLQLIELIVLELITENGARSAHATSAAFILNTSECNCRASSFRSLLPSRSCVNDTDA